MIPGRVTLGRRQALEHHLLLEEVRYGPGTLTPQADGVLAQLLEDRIDRCHDMQTCPPERADPDDVSMVLHDWISELYASEYSECSKPTWVGYNPPGIVADALKMEDVWE